MAWRRVSRTAGKRAALHGSSVTDCSRYVHHIMQGAIVVVGKASHASEVKIPVMHDAMSVNKLLATSLQGHRRWLLSINPLESENQAVAQSQSLVLNVN